MDRVRRSAESPSTQLQNWYESTQHHGGGEGRRGVKLREYGRWGIPRTSSPVRRAGDQVQVCDFVHTHCMCINSCIYIARIYAWLQYKRWGIPGCMGSRRSGSGIRFVGTRCMYWSMRFSSFGELFLFMNDLLINRIGQFCSTGPFLFTISCN